GAAVPVEGQAGHPLLRGQGLHAAERGAEGGAVRARQAARAAGGGLGGGGGQPGEIQLLSGPADRPVLREGRGKEGGRAYLGGPGGDAGGGAVGAAQEDLHGHADGCDGRGRVPVLGEAG